MQPGSWGRALTDMEWFEKEQEALGFAWTVLGLTTEVRRDGEWFTAKLGGRSVFVQRFGDRLEGFENLCPHRFLPLRREARGQGSIRCGYHHWSYGADGRVTGIPKCREMFGCTPREMDVQLRPVEVATCGSLVFGRFVRGDASRPTLEEWLGPAAEVVRHLTSDRDFGSPLLSPFAANWKLGYHISMDDYHLAAVHPDTFGRDGYLDPELVHYHRFGDHSAYFLGSDGPSTPEAMAEECRTGRYRPVGYRIFQLFPNFLISHIHALGRPWVLLQQYVPEGPDTSLLRSWSLPLAGSTPGPLGRTLHRVTGPALHAVVRGYIRKLGAEDNAICEGIQSVARQIQTAPIVSRHEERILWFQDSLREWTGLDSTPESP